MGRVYRTTSSWVNLAVPYIIIIYFAHINFVSSKSMIVGLAQACPNKCPDAFHTLYVSNFNLGTSRR